MSVTTSSPFSMFTLTGANSSSFLQGQVTCNVKKITNNYQSTAISNLKGRVQFGIWLSMFEADTYHIVISADCAEAFANHVKKYGAFSKITLSEPKATYPCVLNDEATFSTDSDSYNFVEWKKHSIAHGNYWITAETQDLFQPQELRLHQRGGVDYDKGCYLGQEVIARIYFKSAPKAFLHRVTGNGNISDVFNSFNKVKVVNAMTITDEQSTEPANEHFEALIIGKPDDLSNSPLTILPLPEPLQESVARQP